MNDRSNYEQGFLDGVILLAERLRIHYPHSNSILRRIDVEESALLYGGDVKMSCRFFALPDSHVKKIAFIADCFEHSKGYRPPDHAIILSSIDYMFRDIAESIDHGVCEGDDDCALV